MSALFYIFKCNKFTRLLYCIKSTLLKYDSDMEWIRQNSLQFNELTLSSTSSRFHEVIDEAIDYVYLTFKDSTRSVYLHRLREMYKSTRLTDVGVVLANTINQNVLKYASDIYAIICDMFNVHLCTRTNIHDDICAEDQQFLSETETKLKPLVDSMKDHLGLLYRLTTLVETVYMSTERYMNMLQSIESTLSYAYNKLRVLVMHMNEHTMHLSYKSKDNVLYVSTNIYDPAMNINEHIVSKYTMFTQIVNYERLNPVLKGFDVASTSNTEPCVGLCNPIYDTYDTQINYDETYFDDTAVYEGVDVNGHSVKHVVDWNDGTTKDGVDNNEQVVDHHVNDWDDETYYNEW